MTSNVFGSAPVPFTPQAAPADGDYGDRLELTGKKLEGNQVYNIVNPEYLGKALLIENISVSTFKDKQTQEERQAIDATKITVVETGQVFERQRLFSKGIVRQLVGLAGQTVVAGVGFYEVEARPGNQYVQLVAPTAEQQAKGAALAAKAADEKAPF